MNLFCSVDRQYSWQVWNLQCRWRHIWIVWRSLAAQWDCKTHSMDFSAGRLARKDPLEIGSRWRTWKVHNSRKQQFESWWVGDQSALHAHLQNNGNFKNNQLKQSFKFSKTIFLQELLQNFKLLITFQTRTSVDTFRVPDISNLFIRIIPVCSIHFTQHTINKQ